MKQRKAVVFAAALALLALLTTCGESQEKIEQKAAADDARKALRKVEASTQVGASFQQYGQLVIEAKAQVNEASAKLPEGELKRELNAAAECYGDAAQVWGMKARGESIEQGSEQGNTLESKYGRLKAEVRHSGAATAYYEGEAMRQMGPRVKSSLTAPQPCSEKEGGNNFATAASSAAGSRRGGPIWMLT